MQQELLGIRNVLFDLDGTLVDSSATIGASLAHALEQMNAGPMAADFAQTFIGRPLFDIFRGEFAMSKEQARQAIDHYRLHYDALNQAGTRVYEGIPDLLTALQFAGYRLFVATVKPTKIAEKVLGDMELRPFFDGVAGASMGPERREKAGIIAHALARYGLEAEQSLMVGDRGEDIAGARVNGLRAIGVAYGFGSRQELASARPFGMVGHSAELAALFSAD
jgi:phosphoglycolate phosphatase